MASNRTRILPTLGLAACMACASSAGAQRGRERELAEAKAKVEMLMRHADELQELGRHEEAREVLGQARELRARLERSAQEQREGREKNRAQTEHRRNEEILEGLEHGVGALEALGKHDFAEKVERILREFRKKVGREHGRRERDGRARGEREIVEHRLVVYRHAFEAIRKAGNARAADQVEHVIHAYELALSGRRDEEAAKIRKSAPKLGARVELLGYARKLLDKAGRNELARAVGKLATELRKNWEHQRKSHEREEDRSEERAVARKHLEILEMARKALDFAGHERGAKQLHHVIRATEVALEGRRDREAAQIRESRPGLGAQVELLAVALRVLKEQRKSDAADLVARLREHLIESMQARERRSEDRREHDRREGDRGEREHDERARGDRRRGRRERDDRRGERERIEALLERIEKLEQTLEALLGERRRKRRL